MITTEPKLKILQVTAALNEGGVERGTLEMAAFTAAHGAESHVASNGGKLLPELEKCGAKHYLLPLAKRNLWSVLWSAMKLANIIRENNIDLVHARSRAPAWAAFIACRLTNTKFITTFHGTHKIQNRFKRLYNSVMVRGVRVIAISEFIRQHIMDNYQVASERIDVAPRGVDPEIFNPELFTQQDNDDLRRTLGIKTDELVISLPGRLTRWKGQTVFLRALGEIKDIPWRALLIGGAGNKRAYEDELKKLAVALGIENRVKILGSQRDIARYYAVSNLVVSASTEPEAFGRVAIEAQAMATPIVSSAHGGSLETVKDGVTGWLYAPQSAADLAEKLRMALELELTELNSIGQLGNSWVSEKYTTLQMCRKEWMSYSEVLSTSRGVEK